MPAKYVCAETAKTNVRPTPPGASDGPAAGQFLCYKVKCSKATLPAITLKEQFGERDVTPKTAKLVCAPATPTAVTTTTMTSTCPPATAAYRGSADCSEGGMPGCPPSPALCPPGMTCTTTGTSCGCTGPSIPCGDPRLSGLTCNFCKWGTCPPG
jgi:hypothetical protein